MLSAANYNASSECLPFPIGRYVDTYTPEIEFRLCYSNYPNTMHSK